MQRPSDEILIAFLDGELAESERTRIAQALAEDEVLRDHAARLTEGAGLIRSAFDEVLREPVPERLIDAARSPESVTQLRRIMALLQRWRAEIGERPWWIAVPVAASFLGLVVGGGFGYFAGSQQGATFAAQQAALTSASGANWLDSIAGYHKLFVNAGPDDRQLMDVPADSKDDAIRKASQLPADFRLPDLKPWGLAFQGARFLMVDGQPATQLFYTTDNDKLGPVTLVVGNSPKPDLAPTFDRRDDVNLLYWRHHGHFYVVVGAASIGYLWNIHNDIAWQLDAI